MPPRGDITTRVAVLEQKMKNFIELFEYKLEKIQVELTANSKSTRWVLRTMIGILVAFVGGVAILVAKGRTGW